MPSISTQQALQTGVNLHQAGNLAEAEKIYRQVLTQDPKCASAWHLLGVLAAQCGQHDQAVDLIGRAIALEPGQGDFHANLGNVLREKGDLDGAMKAYQRTLQIQPDRVDAHINAGLILLNRGDWDRALQAWRTALKYRPDSPDVHRFIGVALGSKGDLQGAIASLSRSAQLDPKRFDTHGNLAVALEKSGEVDAAIASYERAIVLNPSYAEGLSNMSVALERKGELAKAIAASERAIALNPNVASFHFNFATVLLKKGDVDRSLAESRRATELNPQYAEAFNNLSLCLGKKDRWEEALAASRRAEQINPNDADILTNLGVALVEKGDLAEAIASFRRAIEIKPTHADAYSNMGDTLDSLNELDEAIKACQKSIEVNPDLVVGHCNLSMILLKNGNFVEGWTEYDWRVKMPDQEGKFPTNGLWNGEDISSKTLLLIAEQGLGDTIQFARYLPMVRGRAGKVMFRCQTELVRFLSDNLGEYAEIHESPLGKFDVQIPLLSLGRIFKADLANIPAKVPYLRARPDLIEVWKSRFDPNDRRLRIGLAWAGRPTHVNDAQRSISLSMLAPLVTEQVSFHSVQVGPKASQAASPPLGMSIVDHSTNLRDYCDTAALVHHLDLVISVDTSVVHLAGAMGKPTWVMVPFSPDWRWMMERGDSPWYPSIRLFRQKSRGDWTDVIQRIAAELKNRTIQTDKT